MTTAVLEPAPASPALLPSQGEQRALPLGELLVRAGIVTPDELEAALSEQANKQLRLGETLVELGFVEEESLLPYLGQQLGVPTVRLREGLVDPVVVKLIPRAKAESLTALALFRVRGTLTVAMAEPQNLQHVDEVERMTGLAVRPVFALRSVLERLVPRCYEEDFAVDAVTADIEGGAVELESDAVNVDLQKIEAMADGSPVVNLVNYLIVHAVRQGASDIHIEPGRQNTSVRFRVDGQLREVLRPRCDFHAAIVSRLKVMGRLDIAEHRVPQDGRMHVLVEGHEIDLRISTLPTVLGEKVVLRVLDRHNVTFHLNQLGVPDDLLGQIKSMLAKPYGLLLVTGPTGSGKTTTLYSAIELVKSVHRNIITVEDPVEYQLELINQVQVGATKAMNFAGVLRSILRQDPDVIMVGEIRDAETAEVAVQAALTGHLVLSTLHTNDSASAVTRLLDMGVASFKIAAALVGVIAQRLVRTICPDCRTQYYPPAEFLDMIHYAGDKRRQFTRGAGCSKCYDTGCRGRIGIYEVLTATPELRGIIGKTPNVGAIQECHRRQGGTSLLAQGIRRAEEGRTSLDEIMRVAFFRVTTMQFQYSAKARTGQPAAGMIESDSIAEARQRLRDQGLFVLTLTSQRETTSRVGNNGLRFGRPRVSKTDVLMLTSQLSIMGRSGLDLAEAFKHVAQECPNPFLKKILAAVYEDISSGKPVSMALRRQKHVFGDAYVASIAAAEASGTMTEVLGRLADLLRNEIRLRSTLRAILSYPIVLSFVALTVIAALVFFVLPQFACVFADLGTPAPPTTQMLMDGATAVRENFLILLTVFALAVFAVWRFWFTDRAAQYWDGLALHGPVIRRATQPLLIGRVFRLLGTMLESGIPLLEAIQLCRSSVRNRLYRTLFDSVEREITSGRGIANALAKAAFVPAGAAQMVTTAERTGNLGSVMQAVGEFYEDDGERQMRNLAKQLEPAIIVFMGIIVGFVVLSIMLPLLDVSTVAG